MTGRLPLVLLLLLLVVAAPTGAAAPAGPQDAVFCIGTPDGGAMEFGLVDESWRAYARQYPKPIVYQVGKDQPTAWPYIHPSDRDTWAGGKPHTFTIRFSLNELPTKPLHLIIGQADAYTRSEMSVTVNQTELGRRRVPAGSGRSGGLASQAAQPASMIFAVPLAALRVGENELRLTLSGASWILYDYVYLGPRDQPLPLVEESREWVDEAMAGPMRSIDDIVFAVRTILAEHWYANFGYFAPDENRKAYGKGGRLCALNLKTGKLRLLLEDAEGAVRDPCVDYDGRRIVFSYRKAGCETYHLYEINADGSGLKQLTEGIYDDIEPCCLPDGGIVFVSARSKRWVNCWLTQVANLYRCDADGSNVRPLSANLEHDNTPWVLPDGRILYMRWEYVDRSQVHYHHLWAMNPDGTGQTVFFGNLHPGGVYIDARPIPGTDRIVTINSPGHGTTEHAGHVATVSAKHGPDRLSALRNVTRARNFRDPWAIDDETFLAAREGELVLINGRGAVHTLFRLPAEYDKAWLHEPRPLTGRPREPVLAAHADLAQRNGRFLLNDVTLGRNTEGIKPGEIKKLLVIESLPKPINFTGGMDPLSYAGTFSLERVLGTVPVEEDGSAYFEAPAMRSLFFVALDENDLAVKRMQSFTTVAPGETQSCVGCHEQRVQTPPAETANIPLAARRRPSRITPVVEAPFDVPDFPRDVQPVLDRHCVKCHNPDTREGGVLLSGDHGPMFSHGYYSLVVRKQVADGRNLAQSNYPPRALGSGGSPLMRKLDGSHNDVQPTEAERRTVRLWLDAGAPYPGTYAALGTGMIGGYEQNNQILENDRQWPETLAAQDVFQRRCAACHSEKERPIPRSLCDEIGLSFWKPSMDDPRLLHSRHIVFNLTRPEKSLLLLSPLSKAAGGAGLCRPAEAAPGSGQVFAEKDEDYRRLLAMVEAGRRRLDEIKRFDMPGFRPRPEYVREMKRYGVLPPSFDLDRDPIDVYQVDRQYWKSLWW